uniref:Lymphocyte specific protein 1 a n=1 Tax=Xiphophorus couchianus TaxID=32473 RepID=A0A3B5LES6_9TELE
MPGTSVVVLLPRLTAQRSIEDAEEVERERRQKARESLRRRNSGSTPEDSSPESEAPEEKNTYDRELKPSSSPSLEEDEGFSDWTQRREKQRQQRLQELSQDGEEEEEEENVFIKNNVANKAAHPALTPFSPVQRQDQKDTDSIRMKAERRNKYEEEVRRVKERGEMKKDKVLLSTKQETQRSNTEVRVLHQTFKFSSQKTSQEPRALKVSLSDLPNSPEVVASKKNLFEAGEAWSPNKGATCKVTKHTQIVYFVCISFLFPYNFDNSQKNTLFYIFSTLFISF